MQSSEPEVFGEYLLVRRLAEGHLAEAMVAVRLGDRSGRTFVVKRPRLGERASGAAAQATRREAEVLGAIRSPHLVALEDTGTVAGLPFVALEHVRGVPLDRMLTQVGPLPPAEALAVARDVLTALAALHQGGWVHGDVAPSNVMVDEAGEARLLDLGIAARIGEKRPGPAGKPGYVAPEAMAGRPASPSEDVYAWAVVFSECLLGRRLFVERDLSEAATRDGPPPAVAQLESWGSLLTAALALDEGRRPTLEELRAEIERASLDRGALAETVARVQAAGDPIPGERVSRLPLPAPPAAAPPAAIVRAPVAALSARDLTPTAPAPAVTLVEPAEVASAPTPPPIAKGSRRTHLQTFLIALAAAVLAWFAGRRLGGRNPRGASIGLSAALPARARLQIDGRVVVPPEPGKNIPVDPGRHTISITVPRKEPLVFDVVAGPGEHVVLLLQLGPGKRGDRQRTDGPGEIPEVE